MANPTLQGLDGTLDVQEGDGLERPNLGPSDSTDSPSDRPAGTAATDSDAQGSGDRESVEPPDYQDTQEGADISADEVVDEDEAGLAHTPPDPARNGG